MLQYTVTLTPDTNGTLLVGFPDFPEAHSVGNDKEDALLNAAEALDAVVDMYMYENRPIPMPTFNVSYDGLVCLKDWDESDIAHWNSTF